MRIHTRTLPALVAIVLAAAGCSIRSDDKPRVIPSVPTILSQANPNTGTSINPAAESFTVYLVRAQGTSEMLEATKVAVVPPANAEDLPRVIIEALVQRPPVSDNSDLKSDIPATLTVRKVALDKSTGILDIDLHGLDTIQGTNQRLAVAQLVFTATAIEQVGIRGVRFFEDGQPTPVPLDDRSSQPGDVVTRDDFPRLRPGASAATTTTLPPETLEGDAPPVEGNGETIVPPDASPTAPTDAPPVSDPPR